MRHLLFVGAWSKVLDVRGHPWTQAGFLLRVRPSRGAHDAVTTFGLGTAHGDDVQALGPGLKAPYDLRRYSHDIPLAQISDFVVKQHPPRSGDDDVGLLLLFMTVSHRTAQVRRVAKEADPEVPRIQVLAAEPTLDPRCPVAHGVLDFQQVHGGKARHWISFGRG
jgi:hypothetical protein